MLMPIYLNLNLNLNLNPPWWTLGWKAREGFSPMLLIFVFEFCSSRSV